MSGSPSACRVMPARAARSASPSSTSRRIGNAAVNPERDDLAAGLELGEEEDVVDQLADLLDLAPRLLDEVGRVEARELRRLEKGHDPREWRSQLVRDGGGESRPQLLVGGELSRLGEVEERLLPARDLVRDREGNPARVDSQELVREDGPLVDSLERLPGAATRGDDVTLLVEDEDDLPALLDEHPPALRLDERRPGGAGLLAGPADEPLHTVSLWRRC